MSQSQKKCVRKIQVWSPEYDAALWSCWMACRHHSHQPMIEAQNGMVEVTGSTERKTAQKQTQEHCWTLETETEEYKSDVLVSVDAIPLNACL